MTGALDASAPFNLDPSFLKKKPDDFQAYEKFLNDTLEEPPESFGRKDMALLNLLCAPSVDGSENLDIAKCLNRVDQLAVAVKAQTERSLYLFPRDPEHGHCEAMWRMGMLITVVKRDFGASYRPSVREDIESGNGVLFNDSKDTFIHGLLADEPSRRWGTCASLPVLVAAVARRLNYPVGLAVSGRHVYARWDTGRCGGLVFNIEASGPAGMVIHTDDYYRQSMQERGTGDVDNPYYLRTLHPAEEFGLFLSMRVEHLIHGARYQDTFLWSARSLQFAPDDPAFPPVAHAALRLGLFWRLKHAHPETQIPKDLSKSFIFEVGDLLAVEERCLYQAILGHYHESKGELEEARTYYENACRQNFHGNNEQRDLQRFLRKYNLPKRTHRTMPRNLGLRRRVELKDRSEVDIGDLRCFADSCVRKGNLLKAREALHDLYLIDPCDGEVFQQARAIEQRPQFHQQVKELVAQHQRVIEQSGCAMTGVRIQH